MAVPEKHVEISKGRDIRRVFDHYLIHGSKELCRHKPSVDIYQVEISRVHCIYQSFILSYVELLYFLFLGYDPVSNSPLKGLG